MKVWKKIQITNTYTGESLSFDSITSLSMELQLDEVDFNVLNNKITIEEVIIHEKEYLYVADLSYI